MRIYLALAAMAVITWVVPAAPLGIVLDQVASGLTAPTLVTHAGDGSGRRFIVDQTGEIRILDAGGTLLGTPFLDIDPIVLTSGERGLLGLAFHPDYENNGFFFVNYTNNSGNTVVARYPVDPGNPNLAVAASAEIIITINQTFTNHNGGMLAFGPDGYLYVFMGDGGSAGDPGDEGQDNTTLLGAILRLDVDSGLPYTAPADNPFVGVAGADEIWATGVRNPWRSSFDQGTGLLFVADVGQNRVEEITVIDPTDSNPGHNLGWDTLEGSECFNESNFNSPLGSCSAPANYLAPLHEYGHGFGDCSITGGYVYRGSLYPDLFGRYFFGDYCTGNVWTLEETSAGVWSSTSDFEMDLSSNLLAFGEDEDGNLYMCLSNGTVQQITHPVTVPVGLSLLGVE